MKNPSKVVHEAQLCDQELWAEELKKERSSKLKACSEAAAAVSDTDCTLLLRASQVFHSDYFCRLQTVADLSCQTLFFSRCLGPKLLHRCKLQVGFKYRYFTVEAA
jgi:hypothetical protein